MTPNSLLETSASAVPTLTARRVPHFVAIPHEEPPVLVGRRTELAESHSDKFVVPTRPRRSMTGQVDFVEWALKCAVLMGVLIGGVAFLMGSLSKDPAPRASEIEPTDVPTLHAGH